MNNAGEVEEDGGEGSGNGNGGQTGGKGQSVPSEQRARAGGCGVFGVCGWWVVGSQQAASGLLQSCGCREKERERPPTAPQHHPRHNPTWATNHSARTWVGWRAGRVGDKNRNRNRYRYRDGPKHGTKQDHAPTNRGNRRPSDQPAAATPTPNTGPPPLSTRTANRLRLMHRPVRQSRRAEPGQRKGGKAPVAAQCSKCTQYNMHQHAPASTPSTPLSPSIMRHCPALWPIRPRSTTS